MAERRDDHERHVLPIGSENVRRRLISCVRTNITMYLPEKVHSKQKVIHSSKIQSFIFTLPQTRSVYVRKWIFGKYLNLFFQRLCTEFSKLHVSVCSNIFFSLL